MAAACAVCGAKKAHSVHVRAVSGARYHAYEDASKAGLRAVSQGRDAYNRSQTHKDAVAGVAGAQCAFEAAGVESECRGPITPHHTLPRGRGGGLARAERLAPVVAACALHNAWATTDGLAWSEAHFVHVDGRDWPLVMSTAMAREIEAAAR